MNNTIVKPPFGLLDDEIPDEQMRSARGFEHGFPENIVVAELVKSPGKFLALNCGATGPDAGGPIHMICVFDNEAQINKYVESLNFSTSADTEKPAGWPDTKAVPKTFDEARELAKSKIDIGIKGLAYVRNGKTKQLHYTS